MHSWQNQNNNESFNNLAWVRWPKNTFCGQRVLSIAVYDAVLWFNEGNKGRVEVLRRIGIEPGMHTIKIFNDIDQKRIENAEENLSKLYQAARQQRRSHKRKAEDDEEEYSYGGH